MSSILNIDVDVDVKKKTFKSLIDEVKTIKLKKVIFDNKNNETSNTDDADDTQKNKFILLIDELKSKTLIKLLKPTIPSSSKLESPVEEIPDIDVNQMWDSRSI